MTTETSFWRLREPEYSSDYADTFINGHLEHALSLPGVACEQCGAQWGGITVLPYELPSELQSFPPLRARALSGKEHAKLRATVLQALRRAGARITEVPVGSEFQPAYLDVPSRPEADFLWSGLGSVVVSQRIRDTLIEAGIKGGVFVPVVPRKIGKRKAKLPSPVPSTGEPEDLITEMKRVRAPQDVPPYYELVITAESGLPPGVDPQAKCALCGRQSYNDQERSLVMGPEMWRGDDIFLLATTLWIIVTDSFKRRLQALRPTNVVFAPMARAT